MVYEIFTPQHSLNFSESPKAELVDYYESFLREVPDRLAMLYALVHETPGFLDWVMDFTPDSLLKLNEWYFTQIETEKRTEDEIAEIKSKQPFDHHTLDYDLTVRTLSVACDVGIYLGQVMLNSHPALRWEHWVKDKRFIDYGQPTIMAFKGGVPMNPVHIARVLAYGIAAGKRDGQRLRAIFEHWSRNVVPMNAK